MSEKVVLAIDPSVNDVGFVWLTEDGDFIGSEHIKSPKDSKNIVEKVRSICLQIETLLKNQAFEITEIIIEHTRYFAQNQRTSHASAQKLNLVKGAIYGLCMNQCTCDVHLVWIPGFKKEYATLLARSKKLPKVTQHERDAFWLGNTWLNSAATIKNHWKENPSL
jgi:hypothetical protein